MSNLKKGKSRKGFESAEKVVVVAVKASKEISKNALVWALTHVVQSGNSITLVVVMPSQSPCIISFVLILVKNFIFWGFGLTQLEKFSFLFKID